MKGDLNILHLNFCDLSITCFYFSSTYVSNFEDDNYVPQENNHMKVGARQISYILDSLTLISTYLSHANLCFELI